MPKIPVRIVPPYTNVAGGVMDLALPNMVLEQDIGAANIAGGVLPVTQGAYDTSTSTNTLLLEDGTPILLEQDGSNLLMEQ